MRATRYQATDEARRCLPRPAGEGLRVRENAPYISGAIERPAASDTQHATLPSPRPFNRTPFPQKLKHVPFVRLIP